MTRKKSTDEFATGKERLDEIGRRLDGAFGGGGAGSGSGGLLGGLGTLIARLGTLAEQAEKAGGTSHSNGEFDSGGKNPFKAVYGFTVKSGIGDQKPKVEPFGNVHTEPAGGKVEVHEIREPMVDLFDEPDQVLVVAEIPGIQQEDVSLELNEDILLLSAESGDKKYRKEILLPESFAPERMRFTCRSGVLEIRLLKQRVGA